MSFQTIDSAPRDGTTIQARIPGHGDDNLISFEYIGDGAWGWTFTTDQEPPADWTDGWCWAENEDGVPSTQPTHWKPWTPTTASAVGIGPLADEQNTPANSEGGETGDR